MTVVALEG